MQLQCHIKLEKMGLNYGGGFRLVNFSIVPSKPQISVAYSNRHLFLICVSVGSRRSGTMAPFHVSSHLIL